MLNLRAGSPVGRLVSQSRQERRLSWGLQHISPIMTLLKSKSVLHRVSAQGRIFRLLFDVPSGQPAGNCFAPSVCISCHPQNEPRFEPLLL